MIKDDFPYFMRNRRVYLDNASTTQKPKEVVQAIEEFYLGYYSNTHRGSYEDGNRATIEFEAARDYISEFIGAKKREEIIFTKGATEGINLVANSFVKDRFDTVIISSMEHHSNIVPWHMLGYKKDKGLKVVGYKDDLSFDMEHFKKILTNSSKPFVSITHVSNAFGVIHPVKEIVEIAHSYGAKVLIDGAQAISHLKLNISELDPDFYVFSGHKCYGPTGVGVLYSNNRIINQLNPYQTGGATIDSVSFEETTLLDPPLCFEAGTQNIAGVIGLKRALEYMKSIGHKTIEEGERSLLDYIYRCFGDIDNVELYTSPDISVGNISFNIKGITPIDIGILLDKQGVSIRCGHHCAMPIMDSLGIQGTARLSLGLYNSKDDIDKFFKALKKALDILRD